MKLICSQSDLSTHLSLASRAVPSRPERIVLGNVLLVAEEETQIVGLTGFDGNLAICTNFNAEVVEGGKITLPAKLFNDIVSRLPEMEITLASAEDNTDEESILATLSSASGKFQLRGIDAAEFPELPVTETAETINLPVSAFSAGLGGCLFAASTELSKQILTGVHLTALSDAPQGALASPGVSPGVVAPQGDRENAAYDGEGCSRLESISNRRVDSLEFAATDSHRLAVVKTILENQERDKENPTPIETTNNITDFALTIPARALRELERMLTGAKSEEQIQFRFDDTQIVFELKNQRLTCLRLTGAYPAYQQLIPRQFTRQMIVERKRLISSLELVAVIAQKNNIVKFSLDGNAGQLFLSVDAKDVGSAKESLPAEITGGNLDIAFNIKYLMDGLKALPAEQIKMQLNDWNQPVIFTPLGRLQMTYLVMPVQIRN